MHGRSLLTRGPEQGKGGSETASSKAVGSQGTRSIEGICVHEKRIDSREDENHTMEGPPSVQPQVGKCWARDIPNAENGAADDWHNPMDGRVSAQDSAHILSHVSLCA